MVLQLSVATKIVQSKIEESALSDIHIHIYRQIILKSLYIHTKVVYFNQAPRFFQSMFLPSSSNSPSSGHVGWQTLTW